METAELMLENNAMMGTSTIEMGALRNVNAKFALITEYKLESNVMMVIK